jgi:hypothetical protein
VVVVERRMLWGDRREEVGANRAALESVGDALWVFGKVA